jgi:hypothetical protein
MVALGTLWVPSHDGSELLGFTPRRTTGTHHQDYHIYLEKDEAGPILSLDSEGVYQFYGFEDACYQINGEFYICYFCMCFMDSPFSMLTEPSGLPFSSPSPLPLSTPSFVLPLPHMAFSSVLTDFPSPISCLVVLNIPINLDLNSSFHVNGILYGLYP